MTIAPHRITLDSLQEILERIDKSEKHLVDEKTDQTKRTGFCVEDFERGGILLAVS
jgi:hypothetical protein